MTRACERLLRYVTFYTTSDPSSGTIPSTSRQFDLASALAEEMILMGLKDVRADEHCYVYGWLPATPGYEDQTALGFIAHLDCKLLSGASTCISPFSAVVLTSQR